MHQVRALVSCILKDYKFLEIYPFFSRFPICLHITSHSTLFWVFCMSVILVIVSPLSFLILLIWVLSLFLTSLAKGFFILLMSAKKSAQFHWPFLLHLFLGGGRGALSYMSSLMFIISLFLTTLGFVLTPSIGRLNCLFEIFLVDLYCYKLPSESCFSIAHGFWQVFIFISICLQGFSDFLFNFFIDLLIFFFLTVAFFFFFLQRTTYLSLQRTF